MTFSGHSDNYGHKLFFMSNTRNKHAGESWASKYTVEVVRFELDGDMLNTRYKALPVDYWAPKRKLETEEDWEGTLTFKQRTMRDAGNGRIDFNRAREDSKFNEMEDRIVSNEPVIKDFSKYIKVYQEN